MADAKYSGFPQSGPKTAGDDPLSPPRPPQPRAVGSPLPVGAGIYEAKPAPQQPGNGASANGRRQLGSGNTANGSAPSGMQRAVSAFRAAIPFVQRLLPLIDGNIGTAVANMLVPQQHHAAPPAPPAPPPVDLTPLHEGLATLTTRHAELRDQLTEQNSSLKKVEDRLEMVREATDRNTLEQQELMEDLRGISRKVKIFAIAAFALLAVSVLINVVLYLHIVKVLP